MTLCYSFPFANTGLAAKSVLLLGDMAVPFPNNMFGEADQHGDDNSVATRDSRAVSGYLQSGWAIENLRHAGVPGEIFQKGKHTISFSLLLLYANERRLDVSQE